MSVLSHPSGKLEVEIAHRLSLARRPARSAQNTVSRLSDAPDRYINILETITITRSLAINISVLVRYCFHPYALKGYIHLLEEDRKFYSRSPFRNFYCDEEDDDDESNLGKDEDDDDQEDNDDQDNDNDQDDGNEFDSDNNGDDFVHPKFSTHDEEDKEEDSFDHRVQTPSHVKSTDDEDIDEEIQEVEANELYRDVNNRVLLCHLVSFLTCNPSPDIGIDSIFNLNTESTSLVDVLVTAIVEPTLLDEAQVENADFINKLDDNIKKIIKNQVKEQVKAQVFKILPKIEKTVNEQLKAEILTCSSNESKTSHAVAANLSKLELKKIIIDKMESNKSIHRSNEQKNLYKALVDAYESDKLILDTYGDTVSFKRRRDDEDKDEEPSAGSNWGSKRRRAGKE
ncbi:hypothetical protein Tco_0377784 [Tanacetum coccineum]